MDTKFKPGISGNPSGRPKGSKNKSTAKIRSLVMDFVHENLPGLQARFDVMPPVKQFEALIALLKLVLPRPLTELELLSDAQLDELINRLKKDES